MNDFVRILAVLADNDARGDVNVWPDGELTLGDVRLICKVRKELISNTPLMTKVRDMYNVMCKAANMCGAKVLMLDYNGYTQLIDRDLIKKLREDAGIGYVLQHFPCLYEKVMFN